jgi:organic hydroperoxide reductase OsmC/OhrA
VNRVPDYSTNVEWTGDHRGILRSSNGAEMPFSAPEGLHGEQGVLTPEDAFVGALNTCYTLMFIWAMEKLKIELVSYSCETTGHVEEYLDRTNTFSKMIIRPKIVVRGTTEDRVNRALQMAEKYSLIWQSVKAQVSLEPHVTIVA